MSITKDNIHTPKMVRAGTGRISDAYGWIIIDERWKDESCVRNAGLECVVDR